jgi:hypothetical protein
LAARIVDDLAQAGAAALRETMTRTTGRPSLVTVLEAAVAGFWAGVEGAPGAQLLTYEITTYSLRQPRLGPVALRQYAAAHEATATVLSLAADAAGATWLRPVDELAGEVLAFVDGVTLRWLVDRDSSAARNRLQSFLPFLLAQAKAPRAPRRSRTMTPANR